MSGGNSAYSPLPQSNSDSDESSEELHIDEETRVINRISRSQNASPENVFNGPKQSTVNCKLLHTHDDMEATLIRFQSASDEVSILKPNNKIEIFSTSRKVCFSLSLLLCIFTTVIFIWFLPCNEGICISAAMKETVSWKHTLDHIELFGPIGVYSYSPKSKTLLFFTRIMFNSAHDSVNKKNNNNYENKFGLITFKGENGLQKWNISLNEEPKDIDCNMIDVNLDGKKECLVLGSKFLKAIDAVSGKEIWDFQKSKKKQLTLSILDFPAIIYDVNRDSVNDLVMPCSLNKNSKTGSLNADSKGSNYLIIVSGKTGEIINAPMQVTDCSIIHNVTIETNSLISYSCLEGNGKEYLKASNLAELLATLDDYGNERLVHSKWDTVYEHPRASNSIRISGYRVTVDNQGRCPGNCSVAVDIKDENSKNSNNNIVYTYNDRNTYCVLPTIFKSNGLNAIVLKFWKWETNHTFIIKDVKSKVSVKRAVKFKNGEHKLKNVESLYNEMLLESESGYKRYKRGTHGLEKTVPEKNLELNSVASDSYSVVISETIVSISFNKSLSFVRNITQNKLVQSCAARVCEPDIYGQKRSLLTADLNGDGAEELVSFSSTYSRDGSNLKNDSRKLQSTIKVFTLQ